MALQSVLMEGRIGRVQIRQGFSVRFTESFLDSLLYKVPSCVEKYKCGSASLPGCPVVTPLFHSANSCVLPDTVSQIKAFLIEGPYTLAFL